MYEIDADSDGKVTRVEIVEWIMQNEDKGNSKEIDLQWAIYDSDHNGRVSWEEYRTVFLKSEMEYPLHGTWEGSRGGELREREGTLTRQVCVCGICSSHDLPCVCVRACV